MSDIRSPRQGDVLMVRVASLPPSVTPVAPEGGRLIVARGEVTGHHHSVAFSDRVALFREDGSGGGLFLTVSAGPPVALEHQEHGAHDLAPGVWRYLEQRTLNSAGVVRQVVD